MIPSNAKKVFQGVIFDAFQWEQKLFDGTTTRFERLRRPNTVGVLAVVGDKILTQSERQPADVQMEICLPGGRVDRGEEALSAAKRELLEETGYASNDWELLQEWVATNKIEWVCYTYVARDCQKVAEPTLDGGEQIQSKLLTFEELLNLGDAENFLDHGVKIDLVRAKYDPKSRAELSKRLFGK